MVNNNKYTAYCGLYCLDCIPSDERFFDLIKEFDNHLKDLKFAEYAELKSRSNPLFKNFPKFQEVLTEMKKLECKALCTQGGCKEDCEIRKCVKEKKYDGCWDCLENKNCELLQPLKEIHSIEHNLEMIKNYRSDDWIKYRRKHYKWL